ncbi:MAG: DUF4405 domain-containing protein [Candidatus Omnitrophica bacterium]|nr:DUF4405 domain-containing protein [Candidatus Omnitrophota bacterium]
MNKITLLKFSVLILFVSVVIQGISGIVLAFDLYSPASAGLYTTIHEFNGFVFIFLVAAHLFLNWSWIKSVFAKKRG